VHQIIDKLNSTPRGTDADNNIPAETGFAAAKMVLNEHFNPKVNVTFHRNVLKYTKQMEDESVDHFPTPFAELAAPFHDKEKEIKSQIILTCKSKKLRADALTNPTWDLKNLLEKATTYELTKMRVKQIEEGYSSAPSEAVNKIGTKENRFVKPQQSKGKADDKKPDPQKMCNFCGYNWHKKVTV
jgi:hypothetical protein